MHGDCENDREVETVDALDEDNSCRRTLACKTGRRTVEFNWYIRCILSDVLVEVRRGYR